MLNFMTFCAGCLMRLLGTIILGAYVDRVGHHFGLRLAYMAATGATRQLGLASSIFHRLHDRAGIVRDQQFAS